MACPSAVFSEANKFPTHNTHFEPYSPATFLRTRTSLNLDSQSTRETEPTPTPDPQRTLKDAVCFPSLKHRRGSSTALGLTGDRPLSKQFPPHIPTMSLGSEDGDTDDEDIRGVLDKYNIEGVSREDLKLWIQSAPEDQRLEMAHDIKLLPDAFEARYDTEGISREDLELWRELAPPDQRLEAGSDTDEIETNEMDCEPRSRTPGLRSLQEVAPTDARRASSNSIEQSKATQVNHFIRRHPFLQTSLVSHTTSERRSFERDIYDYARGLGLSIGEACKEVFKGRAFCGEDDYNSDDTALGNEVDDSAVTMRRLSTPVMSLLEQPQTHQMADVPAIVTAPRERKRRKKQSTVEPPANTKAENVVMEAEVSAAQRETINVPQGRLKSSEDISSKFFPNERELGKKRKRESADGANVQGQKKPKKETRKQKSNEVDNQAPASEQVDQSVLSAASLSNLEGNSKDRNISLNTQATPDDGVEEMKDTDAMDNKGEVTVNGKNREKRKRRKDKSKGPYGSTTVESAIGPENLSNVVAADEGSDHNAPATAKNSTSHTINESRQEQQSSASAKPAVSSDEGGANHILDLVAAKAARKVRRQERQRAEEEEEIETGEKEDAARKIRKQERRRAKKEKAKEATEKEDAAADLPPAAKINKPDESHEDFDNHPINQITGLPAPSVNELLGISGPNHELSRARTEPTTARGPNDPKSTTEARRNLLISAARDPIEHDMTAETNHEQHSQRTKKSEDADEGQADVEPPKKKKRRKRKSGADEEHADNEDGNENVKTEKVEPVNIDLDPPPRDPGFQSPMIQ